MPQRSGEGVESARTDWGKNGWVTSLFTDEPCLRPPWKRLLCTVTWQRSASPDSILSRCVVFLQAQMISGFFSSVLHWLGLWSPKEQGSERRKLSLGNPVRMWEQPWQPLLAYLTAKPSHVSLALSLFPPTLLQTQQWEVRTSPLPVLAQVINKPNSVY